jgi:hypothetical protein
MNIEKKNSFDHPRANRGIGRALVEEALRSGANSGARVAARRRETIRSLQEGHMCPACIASTAVVVAGVGSTGGILGVFFGKFRKFFRASGLGLLQKTREK